MHWQGFGAYGVHGDPNFTLDGIEELAEEIYQDALADNPEQLETDNAERNASSYNSFYAYHLATALW